VTAAITRSDRWSRDSPCPVCGGCERDPRGQGKRCTGFLSSDGEYLHCSREEHAGGIEASGGTFGHRRHGTCKCGVQHGEDFRALDEIEATYRYSDEAGALLFEVVRKTGKRFLQRKPDGAGGWVWKVNGVRLVPYRLPELLADDQDRPVYVVEGEKDADALWSRGHVATCNPMGAGKWAAVAEVARTAVRGRDVVVVADNDTHGRKHARDVAASLQGVARSVRLTRCPSAKDVADHFAAGGTLDELVPVEDEPTEPDAEAEPEPDVEPTARSIADVVAALSRSAAMVRLPTGIPSLDDSMRGGLPAQRLVVVGGAPGVGKTGVVTRLGYQWARSGVPVGMLCADEGPEGIVDRVALYLACKRELLDAGDVTEWARLATEVQNLPLDLDPGDATIDAMAARVRSRAGDGPGVLIVDSIQTCRADLDEGDRSDRRGEIDRVVRALKRVVATHRLLVLATCELSRAFYRTPALAAQLNPLAAFKESGSIEYAAQTAIVLTTPKGRSDVIDAAVPKNRGYIKRPFRLSLHADLTFHETELPTDDEPAPDPDQPAELDRDVERVCRVLQGRPGLAGKAALRAELRAQGHAMASGRVDAAVARLRVREPGEPDDGQRIANLGKRNRPAWHLCAAPSDTPAEAS
jgi:5S rRNA maturation endonuclease (ribonuclease M5)/archaellum biogenesis ATPase FlaH